jgi:hypothetical protein
MIICSCNVVSGSPFDSSASALALAAREADREYFDLPAGNDRRLALERAKRNALATPGRPASHCSGSIRRDLGNEATVAAFGESRRHQ